MSFGFPREARVTRGAELQRIVREGKRFRTRHLEVRAAASPLARSEDSVGHCRIGLVVPRFKHTAVARNQVKRRLRELGRIHLLSAGIFVDLVLKIRPEAYDASFVVLRAEILSVLDQLHRWSPTLPSNSVPATDT